MKIFTTVMIALVFTTSAGAQCSLDVNFNVTETFCQEFLFENTSIIDCPDAVNYVVKMKYGNGYMSMDGVPTFWDADSVLYYDPMADFAPVETYEYGDGLLASFVIGIYDDEWNLIITDQQSQFIYLPTPPFICGTTTTNASACDATDGAAEIDICGGLPPFTIYDSESSSPIFGWTTTNITGLSAGEHYINIMDSQGCIGWGGFEIGADADNLSGFVYSDENGNQEHDWWEPYLEGREFHIPGPDLTIYSDASGHFVFPDFPPGTYNMEYIDTDGAYLTYGGADITVGNTGCLEIALLAQNVPIFNAWPDDIWSHNIHCINGYNTGLYVHNIGSMTLHGTLTLSFDPMFVATPLAGAVPYNISAPGQLTWNIDQPGASAANYKCHINGPGIEDVFDTFPFVLELEVQDDEGTVIEELSWTRDPMIVCGYDPNDKQSVPVGYTDEHFVLAGDEIEYRIRFQNTGNAPAIDIVIEDQLDTDHLDISTFEPLMASHSFSTSIDAEGLVHFIFNDIMLPDSTSDEAASQGYVVYHINTRDDIAPGSVINNSADIYFDANPAITTNSTWHTIMQCEEDLVIGGMSDCADGPFTWDFSRQYFDTEIYIDGEFYSSGGELAIPAPEAGDVYSVEIMHSNELCNVSYVFALDFIPLPAGGITQSGNVLYANGDGDAQYQWYLNGEIIEAAVEENYTPLVSGNYSVAISTFGGCTLITDAISFTVGIDEYTLFAAQLYPNPMTQTTRLLLPGNNCTVHLNDISGRIVRAWNGLNGILVIERGDLVNGIYTVSIKCGNAQSYELRLVVAGD